MSNTKGAESVRYAENYVTVLSHITRVTDLMNFVEKAVWTLELAGNF
jgi:hypothetical protein